MAYYLRHSDGSLQQLQMHEDSTDDDTILEISNILIVPCEEWSENILCEMAASNSGLSLAWETTSNFTVKMHPCQEVEFEELSDECAQEILDYMNELREDSIKNQYEDDPFYKEEPFTLDDVYAELL